MAQLQVAFSNVARPRTEAQLLASSRELAISGQSYELEPNWLGLRTLTLNAAAASTQTTVKLQFGYALKQAQWGCPPKRAALRR